MSKSPGFPENSLLSTAGEFWHFGVLGDFTARADRAFGRSLFRPFKGEVGVHEREIAYSCFQPDRCVSCRGLSVVLERHRGGGLLLVKNPFNHFRMMDEHISSQLPLGIFVGASYESVGGSPEQPGGDSQDNRKERIIASAFLWTNSPKQGAKPLDSTMK